MNITREGVIKVITDAYENLSNARTRDPYEEMDESDIEELADAVIEYIKQQALLSILGG